MQINKRVVQTNLKGSVYRRELLMNRNDVLFWISLTWSAALFGVAIGLLVFR
ncbi:hypothetical protein [Bradyrhizobium lablabi]|uniref:hypothetical protein n=1 Tax=Bradyrhizobium lablabi TaxID=722472 RepID=UPI000A9BA1C7|nr:hypothetical protein [Bradyrhizobium lablabi]